MLKLLFRIAAEPPVAAPGMTMRIRVPDADPRWGICKAAMPTDGSHNAITVDWGDGARDVFESGIESAVHEYARGGEYQVHISDDVAVLQLTYDNAGRSPIAGVFASRLLSFAYTKSGEEPVLISCPGKCFADATNLVRVDLADAVLSEMSSSLFSGCASLRTLRFLARQNQSMWNGALAGCAALGPRLDIPGFKAFYGWERAQPFADCVALREVHFAAEYEETIRSSAAYAADPLLGLPNGQIFFDL